MQGKLNVQTENIFPVIKKFKEFKTNVLVGANV